MYAPANRAVVCVAEDAFLKLLREAVHPSTSVTGPMAASSW